MKKLVTLMVAAAFFLVACGGAVDTRTEQERYISAMTEATCVVFEMAEADEEVLDAEIIRIFAEHGFDVENEEEMMDLQMKYEGVVEVEEAMMEAFYECAPQEFLDMWEAYETGEFMFEEEEEFVINEEDFVIDEGDFVIDEEDMVIEIEEAEETE